MDHFITGVLGLCHACCSQCDQNTHCYILTDRLVDKINGCIYSPLCFYLPVLLYLCHEKHPVKGIGGGGGRLVVILVTLLQVAI